MLQVLPVNEEGRGAARQRRRRMLPVVRNPPQRADRPGHHGLTCHVDHPCGADQARVEPSVNDIDDVFRDARRLQAFTICSIRGWRATTSTWTEPPVAEGLCSTLGAALACWPAGLPPPELWSLGSIRPKACSRSLGHGRVRECVESIQSKAEDLDADRRFRTIYMTAHAFQALIRSTRLPSRPFPTWRLISNRTEMVLFETRNPLRRAWERW